ncbi:2-oxo acid dehydrogenase subunit E2 [Nocardia sp.]
MPGPHRTRYGRGSIRSGVLPCPNDKDKARPSAAPQIRGLLAEPVAHHVTCAGIGSQGAPVDTPVPLPPQAAMLDGGAIIKRPTMVIETGSESSAIRSTTLLPLTYDDRLLDGASAGHLVTIARIGWRKPRSRRIRACNPWGGDGRLTDTEWENPLTLHWGKTRVQFSADYQCPDLRRDDFRDRTSQDG